MVVMADFEDNVGHAGYIGLADIVSVIDLDLGMQAVVSEQDAARFGRIAPVPHELLGIGEAHQLGGLVEPGLLDAFEADHQTAVVNRVTLHLGVRTFGEGRDLVQEALGPGEHPAAANGIIAAAAGGTAVFGQRVGAVKRVVQAAPAGVGCVEGVAGVGYGHDELRAGDACNLVIDVGGVDGEVGPLGNEVADFD